jgi:2'-5' RNA ligase
VGSTSVTFPNAVELLDHWVWRPEWTQNRTCLYWYLTFREDEIRSAVGEAALRAVRRTSWLDAVPPQWCHVTVADVGFTDDLRPTDVERVTAAVAEALADEDHLRLTLGPLRTFRTALVLETRPLGRLRAVRSEVRRATSAVLGQRHADFHRKLFWPHVSLGYVNRPVDPETAARFRESMPAVEARIDVNALTLAAVTRIGRGYQWQVEGQVDLLGDAARSSR